MGLKWRAKNPDAAGSSLLRLLSSEQSHYSARQVDHWHAVKGVTTARVHTSYEYSKASHSPQDERTDSYVTELPCPAELLTSR